MTVTTMFDFPVYPTLPAADLQRAREWYREKLRVTPVEEVPEGLIYRTGGGRWDLYPSEFAGTNQARAATIILNDIHRVVADLASRGVLFERYDFPDKNKRDRRRHARHVQDRLVQGQRGEHLGSRAASVTGDVTRGRSVVLENRTWGEHREAWP
jgi:catechol 2,3-dioxygenase-like lactoylglutathione lyase family enzyme